jgi:PAS domain S-box-containing protein
MGKRFNIVIILAFCVFLVALSFSWCIGLQQAYAQKKESLQNFVDFIHSSQDQFNHQQYTDIALLNGIQSYQVLRDEDELVSIVPNDTSIHKNIILQALKQKDGFIPSDNTDLIFFKHQIDDANLQLISTSLADVRSQYIEQTKFRLTILIFVTLLCTISILIWHHRQYFKQQLRRTKQNTNKSNLGIYLKLDTSFRIIEYNDIFQSLFNDAKGQKFSQLVKADEQEKVEQYLSQAFNHKSNIGFECTIVQKNIKNTDDLNERRWAIQAKPTSQNGSSFIIISADDISKRYRMEIELRHERNRMHTYINTMHTLLVISDRQGRIIQANQQFIQLIGCEESKVLGKPISNFCPKRSHHQISNYLRNITSKTSTTVSAEFPLIAQTGKEYFIDWRITSVPSDDSEEILLTGLDITESVANNQALKSANIQIREALRSAENANQSKSVFLANMSHEIRTPMSGILGATELMLDKSITDEQKQYIDIIHSSSHALLNIINDILDLSKIESGNFELEQINFDLHQLCNDVYKLFCGAAKQKGIQALYFYSADLPQFWVGDPNRIRQILNNLFSNALKFTHQGRIDLHVQGIPLENHKFDLKIQIKDSGIGIADKKVEQIFSAFQQADSSTSREYGGTGLGLTISQHLANAMQGKIEVESELGVGSAFSLSIPLKPGVSETAVKSTSLKRNYQATVLLAEDNVVNAKIASKILEKLGIKSIVVENGELALNETKTRAFDLVLMDVNMPVMDGITATEKIRELDSPKSQMPILALTANAMMEDKERCLKAGMNGFISKPMKLARLIEELDKILISIE